jgi:hypothetical protein
VGREAKRKDASATQILSPITRMVHLRTLPTSKTISRSALPMNRTTLRLIAHGFGFYGAFRIFFTFISLSGLALTRLEPVTTMVARLQISIIALAHLPTYASGGYLSLRVLIEGLYECPHPAIFRPAALAQQASAQPLAPLWPGGTIHPERPTHGRRSTHF